MKLGVIMDPISGITTKKDSTFAMLLAARRRNWDIFYMEVSDLYLRGNEVFARMRGLEVRDNPEDWYSFTSDDAQTLSDLDVVLMRKDPPFDMEYIYATYLLDCAERSGVLVVNRPSSLRDCNEKLFVSQFPQCAPPTLVTRNANTVKAFIGEYPDVIIKPLDGMGGQSVFRIQSGDQNTSVIIESLTRRGTGFAMVQKYIPEISQGDKRILVIDGTPVDYALARIPNAGETRGNLAAGGTGKGVPLSDRDRWICGQVGPVLREKGLLFVGLDVIGDFLTEINVTSPTCLRELDTIYSLDIAGELMNVIEQKAGA
jgi:glutathione synthase